jgi:hypothetical protein
VCIVGYSVYSKYSFTMRCSKCGRVTKGHEKPWGELCTLTPLTAEELEKSKEEEERSKQEEISVGEASHLGAGAQQAVGANDAAMGVLASLAKEMGHMALAVEAMAQHSGHQAHSQTSDSTSTSNASHHIPLVHTHPQTSPLGAHLAQVQSVVLGPSSVPSAATSYSHTTPTSTLAAHLGQVPAAMQQPAAPPILPHASILECQPSEGKVIVGGAVISRKVVESAKRGEYIVLGDFLPAPETQLSTNYQELEASVAINGTLELKPKRNRKVVDSFYTWLTAFNNFEELLVDHKPDIYASMVAYRRFIQQCDKKYLWSAVQAYDCRFRADLSRSNSFEYQTVDIRLFSEIFDAGSLKNGRKCFRCKSFDHIATNCPFQEGQALEKMEKTMFSKEVCFKFNEDNCSFQACRRAHVCRQCRGPHPQSRCPGYTPGVGPPSVNMPRPPPPQALTAPEGGRFYAPRSY